VLINNSDNLGPLVVLKFFQELILEMQNEEPYTLSYVRTLHIFKGDTIPEIFAFTIRIFEKMISEKASTASKIPVIDTLIACLNFDLGTLKKAVNKNTLNSCRLTPKDNDIFSGELQWCTPTFIQHCTR